MAEVVQPNVFSNVSERNVVDVGKRAQKAPISHRVTPVAASDRYFINSEKLLGKGSYSYGFSSLSFTPIVGNFTLP